MASPSVFIPVHRIPALSCVSVCVSLSCLCSLTAPVRTVPEPSKDSADQGILGTSYRSLEISLCLYVNDIGSSVGKTSTFNY